MGVRFKVGRIPEWRPWDDLASIIWAVSHISAQPGHRTVNSRGLALFWSHEIANHHSMVGVPGFTGPAGIRLQRVGGPDLIHSKEGPIIGPRRPCTDSASGKDVDKCWRKFRQGRITGSCVEIASHDRWDSLVDNHLDFMKFPAVLVKLRSMIGPEGRRPAINSGNRGR